MYRITAPSLSFLLRNCIPLSAISQAKQTHAQMLINGFLPNVTLQTDLLLVYCKCGLLKDGRQIFDKMIVRNMHTWNILIASCVSNSMFEKALTIFDDFMKTGLRPDHFTFPPVFKACAGLGDSSLGIKLHNLVVKLGFQDYVLVGSSILEFYIKNRNSTDAKKMFSDMSCKDSVVWTLMISGFGKAGAFVDALNCFRLMLGEGIKMDSQVIPSFLNACGKEGELMKGKEIHGQVVKSLVFNKDVAIGNSLIEMYAKSGCLLSSENVFRNMSQMTVVTWTTMISCYGVHGKGEKSVVLFQKMREVGVKPNSFTLTAILASCDHSGLIDQGRRVFESIRSDYGLECSVEHYSCMVALLGRIGYLEEAFELTKHMKMKATASIWGALLSGCLTHKNVKIGEIACRFLFELEPRNSSNYIALLNIYDFHGLREDVRRIRGKMRELGLVKTPGCSWIAIGGRIHKFYHGDFYHPLSKVICKILDAITKKLMLPEDFG